MALMLVLHSAQSYTQAQMSSGTRDKAYSIIMLLAPFVFVLTVINIVLLVITILALFRKPRFDGEKKYLLGNLCLNALTLLLTHLH